MRTELLAVHSGEVRLGRIFQTSEPALINTAASARWDQPPARVKPFQRLLIAGGKLSKLKQLRLRHGVVHRAEAAVLMTLPEGSAVPGKPRLTMEMSGLGSCGRSAGRTSAVALRFITTLLCLVVLPLVPARGAEPETTAGWLKSDANPVLGGKYGTCFDVAVLKDGPGYRMWVSWRPKQSVALVESKDGIHWSEPPHVVLGPRTESRWEDDINRPAVLKRADRYHMWYTGQAKGHSSIGYVTSSDGVSWRRETEKPVLGPEQPWEKVAIMCPHVNWDASQRLFRMWYSGGEQYEPDAIGCATSPDGLHWTRHATNPIFRADPAHPWEQHKVTACQVIQHNGWHVMFYIGFRDVDHAQIGVARSRDGITGWERHPLNPIIRPGPGKWDADACYKPFAIYDGRQWLLWYNGRRGGLEQIGLVLHPGQDLGF